MAVSTTGTAIQPMEVPGRNLPSKVPPDNGLQFDARATEAEALGRFAASATLSAYV
jgi:hypothetical protein